MLMETPFVASNFVRWRESIDNTPAGLFVDPTNIAAVAQQIETLFADKRRFCAMQIRGRQFIKQKFNWRLVYEPMQEAVFNLIGAGVDISLYKERAYQQISS